MSCGAECEEQASGRWERARRSSLQPLHFLLQLLDFPIWNHASMEIPLVPILLELQLFGKIGRIQPVVVVLELEDEGDRKATR